MTTLLLEEVTGAPFLPQRSLTLCLDADFFRSSQSFLKKSYPSITSGSRCCTASTKSLMIWVSSPENSQYHFSLSAQQIFSMTPSRLSIWNCIRRSLSKLMPPKRRTPESIMAALRFSLKLQTAAPLGISVPGTLKRRGRFPVRTCAPSSCSAATNQGVKGRSSHL